MYVVKTMSTETVYLPASTYMVPFCILNALLAPEPASSLSLQWFNHTCVSVTSRCLEMTIVYTCYQKYGQKRRPLGRPARRRSRVFYWG